MRNNEVINYKDHVAIEAMKSFITRSSTHHPADKDFIARQAYAMAEAMFAEREKDEHNLTPDETKRDTFGNEQ